MRLLIVAPAWVGDMVMAHTLLQRLVDADPGIEIHVVAPPASAPLALRMPQVQTTHVLEASHGEFSLAKRRALGRRLAALSFDQAIVLPNSWKSALVPLFARIPRRTGWLGEMRIGVLNDWRRLDAARYPLMIERFMALGIDAGAALAAPYPKPRLTVDAERLPQRMMQLGIDTSYPILALCPGAEYGPSKRWPSRHYAAVAAQYINGGGRVWLFGSAADRSVTSAVRELVPMSLRDGVTDLAGRTSLLDAVDLLSVAAAVVTNDSGLMHVAAAMSRPLVAVYGSTSPDFTPPLADNAVVVREPQPCSPCFARECRFGHTDCLTKVQPDRVIATLPAP
ncbi:MAG: lipopolysaccharide heptosyltransferase II [Gammaproteobacteria bacterium]|nr:lipopolysaccharide heptosyltransferase II [Gammaproteobacteria bacterium]